MKVHFNGYNSVENCQLGRYIVGFIVTVAFYVSADISL